MQGSDPAENFTNSLFAFTTVVKVGTVISTIKRSSDSQGDPSPTPHIRELLLWVWAQTNKTGPGFVGANILL